MNTITRSHALPRSRAVAIAALLCALALGGAGVLSRAHAAATPLSGQLDIGSTGTSVTSLQTFLATNSLVYPQGLITGYYGPLTATAVTQLQIAYGLAPVGRVGPLTLDLINQMITNGTPIDVSAPVASNLSVRPSSTGATVTWDTNETAQGSVHYDLTPIGITETSSVHQEPATTGTLVTETGVGTTHTIVISGLAPGHTYYLSTESRDATGNVSVTLSQSFTTTP